MLTEFLRYIEQNNLCGIKDRILLGVSGGIDSMAMARLFITGGYVTAIAHCNFCLRGTESDKDEELVAETAASCDIPVFIRKFDTLKYARENGISVQMAARELRYEWFEEVRSAHNYDFIAVAHNLNDNVETLLINLIRGTGLKGLTGIKPVSNMIIRPLLFATRAQIAEYCRLEKIPFREDRSNADIKYTRNKIRLVLLPLLREINPAVDATLNDTAKRLSETHDIVSRYLATMGKEASHVENGCLQFEINLLLPHIENKTILYELMKPYGITAPLINDLINVMQGTSGGKVITGSHSIIRNRDHLIVEPLGKSHKDIRCEINNTDELSISEGIESAEVISPVPGLLIPEERKIAYLDFSKISFPVVIRRWKRGDSFVPLGMTHSKKLSDYFTDRKFSSLMKEEILLLESGGRIAWIIGERIDDRFRITPATTGILRIKAK